MLDSAQIVDFLSEKFSISEEPTYHIKEIKIADLKLERAVKQKKVYKTVDGSSKFQALVINPNSNVIKASPRLCSCPQCLEIYGSCKLFKDYEVIVHNLNQLSLRSNFEDYNPQSQQLEERDDVNEVLCKGSVVAVAADDKSPDTFWLVMVAEEQTAAPAFFKCESITSQSGAALPEGRPGGGIVPH